MSHVSRTVRITFLLVAAAALALLPTGLVLAQEGEEDAPPEHSQADENGRDGQEVSAENRQDGEAETDDNGDDNGDAETDGNGDAETDGNGDGNGDENGRDGQAVAAQHRQDGNGDGDGDDDTRVAVQQEDDDRSDDANRGSIKIHGTDWDGWPPRNEPHPGCDFLISFHGFTAEGASVTFFAWPPTGEQGEILADSVVFDPQDARGNEQNAVVPFNLEAELAALAAEGFEPHPQQGWHIKVEADAEGTVGGAKQKVFWLDCPPPPPEEQELEVGGGQLGPEGEFEEVQAGQILPGPEDEEDVSVLSAGVEAEQQEAAAAADEAAAPGELPITGGAAAAALIGLGLMITSVGLRRFLR